MMFQVKNGQYIDIPESQVLELIISSLYKEINCTICDGTGKDGKYKCYSCYNGKIQVVSEFGEQMLDFIKKEIKLKVS